MMELDDRPPQSGTWIELNERALNHNLDELRRWFGDVEMCMVVKGNAYGHGYDPIVPLAEAAGIRAFAVYSSREAVGFLKASDGGSRLMVMGHADHRNLPWVLRHGIEPWLNDLHDWPWVRHVMEGRDPPCEQAALHLELETGMYRTGLPLDEAYETAVAIHDHDRARLAGVCTHLAGAEDSGNSERISAQRQYYLDFLARLEEVGIDPGQRHIASSAAALLDPDCRFDLVRVGISSYGLWPSPEVRSRVTVLPEAPRLFNVLSWKARVVALRDVPDGAFVGYGRSYEAEGDQRIAVVTVGYADGFSRALSNQGNVIIRGRRATIVGNVNMNMIQCHVTHIPDIEVGDEVVIIGRQGSRETSVSSFSEFNAMVNYEQMARLSQEIPRVVVERKPRDLGVDEPVSTPLLEGA